MEDDLNFFLQMEDDLNILGNGRRPHFFQMEDDLNILGIRRRPHFFQMEDDLNIFENGRQFQKISNGRQLQYFGK